VIHIVGAGPAGCLLGILLARRGVEVQLHERRGDPRSTPPEAGRSINLALAARGLRALAAAGVLPRIEPLCVRMRGRQLHETGQPGQFIAYGQREHEVIWSVSRAALTAALIEAARELPAVQLHFGQHCTGYDDGLLLLRDASGTRREVPAARIIGADGGGSVLRQALARRLGFSVTEARLPHDYKELHVPLHHGRPPLAMDALHIWPRGGLMLIALPNADGTFTATLFLARETGGAADQPGFDALQAPAQIDAFFRARFADFHALVPDLVQQFQAHPQGLLGTVYCPQWHEAERLLLIGDAAHAIVPFHGQGMNCAFEDSRILDELLQSDPDRAFARFQDLRREDCLAIAQMALENYGEMRDTVRDPRFQRQKALSLALERLHPARFIPRYSMVMFHDEIPYSVALRRGRIQQQILDELTAGDADAAPESAAALITGRLAPLPAPAA
jgi:kynurenine 3-monooxygenase